MKLIALVIKQYDKLFKEQIFNFSDEYKVDFNFETNELKIDKNPDYIEKFYGESIYNMVPIVGINGTGKTTILNLIGTYSPENYKQDPDNQYFSLFELGKEEGQVRFNISCNNLYVDADGNQNKSFNYMLEDYYEPRKFLYVNLPRKSRGGEFGADLTMNQDGLAKFIYSYLWLRDRKIINSDLSCSLYISPNGLENHNNLIPRKIKAIGFLIYKSIQNIFYEEDELIKELLSKKLLSECEEYLKGDVSDYEKSGSKLLKKIVKELDRKGCIKSILKGFISFKKSRDLVSITEYDTKNKTRKDGKEYVESIVNIIECFKKLRKSASLTEHDDKIILLKYSNDNKFLFEKLNEKFTNYVISKIRLEFLYKYYLISETPDYHMSTGEGNLIEIFSQLYSYLSMHEESSDDIILLVDELESGMHLEWSRRLIKILIDNLSEILEYEGKGRRIQLIFTTHSPYMLSDIKPGNVIMIEKNQETGYSEGKVLQNTFAKNIQEIMKENLIDNIYGDFALAKINSMIERLNEKEEQEGNEEELLKEIHLISEPILRNKLLEMYDKKYNTSEFSIEKQLQKLNLNEEQRQQVRAMIKANISNADADK